MKEENSVETLTPNQQDLWHLTAAEGYLELGLYNEADAELDQIDERFRLLQQPLVLKLCVYAGLQQWDLVQTVARKMAAYEPENAQWAIWSASAACRAESVEAAKEILERALQTHPNNANIHYNLSCYESRLHHFRRAQRHLARAIQIDPRFKVIALNDDDLEPLWLDIRSDE